MVCGTPQKGHSGSICAQLTIEHAARTSSRTSSEVGSLILKAYAFVRTAVDTSSSSGRGTLFPCTSYLALGQIPPSRSERRFARRFLATISAAIVISSRRLRSFILASACAKRRSSSRYFPFAPHSCSTFIAGSFVGNPSPSWKSR